VVCYGSRLFKTRVTFMAFVPTSRAIWRFDSAGFEVVVFFAVVEYVKSGEVVLFFNLEGYNVLGCEDGFAGSYFDLFEVS